MSATTTRNWPQIILWAALAGLGTALLEALVLTPWLGPATGRAIGQFLLFFMIGYFVLPHASGDPARRAQATQRRLPAAILFAVIGGGLMLVMNRIWP
jgi:hypothetical protein